jgi:hypothetical protein
MDNEQTTETVSTASQQPSSSQQDQPKHSGSSQKNGGAKVISIPTSSMARIKTEERERGKKQFLRELDEKAKALGFASHEDLLRKAAMSIKQQPKQAGNQPKRSAPQQPQRNGQAHASSRELQRLQRQLQDLDDKLRKERSARAKAEKRAAQLQSHLDAKEAEAELRLAAVKCGVQDVDYAVELLRRMMRGKTEEELRAFDEEQFFRTELRKTHPYLYEIREQPATTASKPEEAGGLPPAPKPEKVTRDGASNGTLDATKMPAEEFHKLLANMGLQLPDVATIPR